MCKSGNRFSKDILISRVNLLIFKNENVICYNIVGNYPFLQMVVLMRFRETPVSIPNTAVKPKSVYDTCTISAGKVDECHLL